MKRSEMVVQLAAMLSEFKDFPLESTEAEADFILKHLVDTYGMLPPEIDKVIEKHLCSVNEWEKE